MVVGDRAIEGGRAGLRHLAEPLAVTFIAGAALILSIAFSDAQLVGLQSVVILVLFATATNLLVGYGGLVSFGQGAFFGIGAYGVALAWLHLKTPFLLSCAISLGVTVVVSLAVGALTLRTRQLYFALVTLAFTQLFFTVVEKWYSFTQGDNGIFGAMVPRSLTEPRNGYLFIVLVAWLCLLILWKLVNSPFGLTLRAIRENRARAAALGIDVYVHQLGAFTVSGAFCGVAGILSVVHEQAAYPQMLEWTQSSTPVIASVIGGMFSFLGPALGAVIYQYGHDLFVRYFQDWQLVLGALLLLIVLTAPDGLTGFGSSAVKKALGRRQSSSGGRG